MIHLLHEDGFNLSLSIHNIKSRKAVIFSHGFLSSKNNIFFRIASLALAFNGIKSVCFNYGVEDVKSRVRILNKVINHVSKTSTSIGLLGTSLGGMTSIISASNPKVTSLALINSVYDPKVTYDNYSRSHKFLKLFLDKMVVKSLFSYDLPSIVKEINKPALIVSGGRDTITPTSMMRALYNDIKSVKKLVVLRECGHALRNPISIARASRVIVDWFKKTL